MVGSLKSTDHIGRAPAKVQLLVKGPKEIDTHRKTVTSLFVSEREVQQAAEIEKYQRDLESSKIQCLQLQSQLNAVQV